MLLKRKKKEVTERIPLQGSIVVEIEPYHTPQHKTYKKIAKKTAAITIGRGYDNDIIIHDPFVSVLHIHLSQEDDETWMIIDQQSENGTTQNGVHTQAKIAIHSGDVITIGRTKLRFFDEKHPIPKTLKLAKPHSLRSKLERPSINTLMTLLAFAAIMALSYFESWKQETASHLVSSLAVGAIIIGIWSSIWAVVSRISTHRAHFSSHAGVFCLFILLQWVIYYISSYIDFFFHQNIFAQICDAVFQICAVAFLLFGALSFATNMAKKKRLFQSLLNAHLLIIGALSVSWIQAFQFDNAPRYASNLRPYLTQFVVTESIDTYMDETSQLFKTSGFEQVKHNTVTATTSTAKETQDPLTIPAHEPLPMPE